MDTASTHQIESLRAQVAHLTALLSQVSSWRHRALENADEDGLIDQHRLISLGETLADIPVAHSASTIKTKTDYDVLIDTEKWGVISTSAGHGQDKELADVRMLVNDRLNPRRMTRTVTTITTGWIQE
jgi:hypothetical protein